MTLDEIMDKVDDVLGVRGIYERNVLADRIQSAFMLSIKKGLMDVEEELIEISKKLEEAGICDYDEFYDIFLKEHSEIVTEEMKERGIVWD